MVTEARRWAASSGWRSSSLRRTSRIRAVTVFLARSASSPSRRVRPASPAAVAQLPEQRVPFPVEFGGAAIVGPLDRAVDLLVQLAKPALVPCLGLVVEDRVAAQPARGQHQLSALGAEQLDGRQLGAGLAQQQVQVAQALGVRQVDVSGHRTRRTRPRPHGGTRCRRPSRPACGPPSLRIRAIRAGMCRMPISAASRSAPASSAAAALGLPGAAAEPGLGERHPGLDRPRRGLHPIGRPVRGGEQFDRLVPAFLGRGHDAQPQVHRPADVAAVERDQPLASVRRERGAGPFAQLVVAQGRPRAGPGSGAPAGRTTAGTARRRG